MPHSSAQLFKKPVKGRALGNWGEEVAARYLIRKGYQIVVRQYKIRQGEIDLIAQKDEILAFIEVKLRKNDSFMRAAEAVTLRKQEKLRMAASAYCQACQTELQPRFDVIEVYAPFGEKTRNLQISHWEDAF
ncbi:MAG: YraN family protein [Oscillospiraceae bacterium]|jgi:putative endonuclease